jgi:hypothetical protein
MEQDKQIQKPDPDDRRYRFSGSQVKIDFPDGMFEEVRPIVDALTERNIWVFPSAHDEFGEFILHVGRDYYHGLQEIRDNFELICSSAIEIVPVRELN